MTLIRKMASQEMRLTVAAMVVGVLACLNAVTAEPRCGAAMKPYMRTGGPCVPDSAVSLSDTMADTLTVEDNVMDQVMGESIGSRPARRKLGSGETAGSAISSIIILLIVIACIWCCCTGRCCGPSVIVQQQSTAVSQAQATAQTQSNNQQVVFHMPEQKPAAPAAPTMAFNIYGASPHPNIAEMVGAAVSAQAGTATASAQTQAVPHGVEMTHLQNGVGIASPVYAQQQAQYPPSVQGYPAAQPYPPGPAPQQQESPVPNYPPAAQQQESPVPNYPPKVV